MVWGWTNDSTHELSSPRALGTNRSDEIFAKSCQILHVIAYQQCRENSSNHSKNRKLSFILVFLPCPSPWSLAELLNGQQQRHSQSPDSRAVGVSHDWHCAPALWLAWPIFMQDKTSTSLEDMLNNNCHLLLSKLFYILHHTLYDDTAHKIYDNPIMIHNMKYDTN